MSEVRTRRDRVVAVVAVPIMLLAGGLVAVQSLVNGRLAAELGTGPRAGLAAAAISFGSGLVLVAMVVAANPRARAGIGRFRHGLRSRGLRPTDVVGGVFGAFLVATQGLTVGTIGVALFSVAVTAGQSSSALLVDHVGLGPSGKQAASTPRMVAAAFAVAAVLLAAGERLVDSFSPGLLLLAALPLLAGAGSAVQQALNGRVAAVAGPWVTTLNNFVVGTSVLLVVLVLTLLLPGELGPLPGAWWLYAGGAMGVGFIWLAAVLVKVHGVLVLGLSMLAGQVITAELLELLAPDPQVGIVGVVAGGLTVAGVLVVIVVRPTTSRA